MVTAAGPTPVEQWTRTGGFLLCPAGISVMVCCLTELNSSKNPAEALKINYQGTHNAQSSLLTINPEQ